MTSPYARKVLTVLNKLKSCKIEKLSQVSGLSLDKVRKAVEELKQRGLIELEIQAYKSIKPGEKLKKLGYMLPERILVKILEKSGGILSIKEIEKTKTLNPDDLLAAIGKALEKKWIVSEKKDGERVLKLTGKEKLKSEEEKLIGKIVLQGEILLDRLSEEELTSYRKLIRRPGLIEESLVKEFFVRITKQGEKEAEEIIDLETISALTPHLIKTGDWKKFTFEKYDLNVKSYPIYPGRRHPLREVIEEIREIFIAMGFEEIDDPLIQLAFWNFDALFQPQDHPARDMQDTFYLEDPNKADLLDEELVQRVKETHENGWITGSTGWGGRWSEEEAKKLVLRTHTTVATVKEVYRCGNRPKKAFIVGNVFRNEKMDYKHSAEFYQVDGIVIDENANIRQLMGVLTEFYRKLGLKKVRFFPSFFPYTEPSIQTSVYIEKLRDWVELAGMGIFRPEVTRPLGVEWPVLAWGCGVERLVMIKYDLDDIRTLYRCDLGWLRKRPLRWYLYASASL